MAHGIIKWFDNKKGFGFIAQDEGGQDVFVHFSVIGGEGFKTLDEGDRVEFEVTQSDKGLKALNVIKLDLHTAGSRRTAECDDLKTGFRGRWGSTRKFKRGHRDGRQGDG